MWIPFCGSLIYSAVWIHGLETKGSIGKLCDPRNWTDDKYMCWHLEELLYFPSPKFYQAL